MDEQKQPKKKTDRDPRPDAPAERRGQAWTDLGDEDGRAQNQANEDDIERSKKSRKDQVSDS